MNREILEHLRKGEDFSAREEVCQNLETTIRESREGLIGMADFKRDLELAIHDLNAFMAKFKD